MHQLIPQSVRLGLMATALAVPALAMSALEPMQEAEMADVHGAALGIVLEDIQLISDVAGVNGKTSTAQAEVDFKTGDFLRISHFYAVGNGGNPTQVSDGNGFTVGDFGSPAILQFPITPSAIVQDPSVPAGFATEDRAAIVLCWSGTNCDDPTNVVQAPGFNTKADIGMRLELEHSGGTIEEVWLEANGLTLDESWLAIWPDRVFGLSLAGNLRLQSDTLALSFQGDGTGNAGNFNPEYGAVATGVNLDLQLGHPFYQPLTVGTSSAFSNGLANAELELRVEPIPNVPEIYNLFYDSTTNVSDLSINTFNFGGLNMTPVAGAPVTNAIEIQGLQIQYLSAKTKDVSF